MDISEMNKSESKSEPSVKAYDVSIKDVKKSDYYDTTGKKVGDFCIGFFGVFLFNIAFSAIIGGLFWLINLAFDGGLGFLNAGFVIGQYALGVIGLIFPFIAIFYFFKKRRFISIGIISSVVIPLLLVGACFGIFFGMMAFSGLF